MLGRKNVDWQGTVFTVKLFLFPWKAKHSQTMLVRNNVDWQATAFTVKLFNFNGKQNTAKQC